MGHTKRLFTVVSATTLIVSLLMSTGAFAQPAVNSLTVQGYIKRADNTAVTGGTYTLEYAVFQGGVAIWGKSISTLVTNGLFSATLSGPGDNLTGSGGTGMSADFSGATLNAALLLASAPGSVFVKVYAAAPIDSENPEFNIAINTVPTSMVSGVALSVDAQAVTVAGINNGSKANASTGVTDAGKLVLLDASGYLSPSMFGSITVPNATGVSPGTGTTITWPAASTGSFDMSQSSGYIATGTGGISVNGALASAGNLTLSAGGGTGLVAVDGAISMSNGGTIYAGTVATNNGANGSITLAPNGTGTVDMSSKRVTNVGTATSGTDAVNKNYVDQRALGYGSRFSTWNANASGTTAAQITSYGWATAPALSGVGTTFATGDGTYGPALEVRTGATDGNVAQLAALGAAGASNRVWPDWNPKGYFRVATSSAAAMATARYYVGYTNYTTAATCGAGVCASGAGGAVSLACKGNGGAGNLNLQNVALFRYANGTTADSINGNWWCVTCNGAGCTESDSSVAVNTTTTQYELEVLPSVGSVTYKINGTTVCTHSTNTPASSTILYPMVNFCTAGALAKSLRLGTMTQVIP